VVDDLLRLKFALLVSALRPGSRRALRSLAVAALVVIVAGGMLVAGSSVDVTDPGQRAALVIAAGALSFGILVAPLAAGLGSAMEPRRFAAFPIPPGRLALGLYVAGFVGVPGLLAITLAVSVESAWSEHPGRGVAVAAGVITALTIILSSQLLVAIAAQLAVSEPAARAVTGTARAVVAVAIASAVLAAVVAVRGDDEAALVRFATVVGRSPGGLTWAAIGEPGGEVAFRLSVAVVALLALGALWFGVVSRLMVAAQRQRPADDRQIDAGLGWFDMTPATPGGVIAARSLLYWTRDPRYRVVLLGLPLAPPLIMVALLIAGIPLPLLWLIPLPFLALFLGWFSHNDAAYDHTAIWMHVSAPLRGAADRWGRLVPPLVLGVPLVLITAPLFALWSGIDNGFEALAGISLGLLFTGLGVSSVVSALAPYPAARPGAGPFDQPPLTGSRSFWAQAGSLVATLGFMSPALTVAWWGLIADARWLPIAGLAGIATGLVMLGFGVLVGGQVFKRRAPDLLSLAQRT
jgi:ABC-2 type transport system permease protein